MSFHNKPNYQIPELIEALKAHRLPHDTPSQLADSFRIGWMACRELAQADSVPAIQGEMNVQLDTDSNPTAPGQQRDVARSVALGQPMGNGQDQAAGRPSAQGDKLLTVAERNIRSFLRSAQFKCESDREAALNCVDVLWEAARAPADSVTAAAGGEIDRLRAALVYVAFALHGTPQHMLAEGITLIDGDTVRVSRDGWTVEASVNPARATPPTRAAESVLEDAARLEQRSQPSESGGMTVSGNGASVLGKLMREQRALRGGVYPDGNPNAARKQGGK